MGKLKICLMLIDRSLALLALFCVLGHSEHTVTQISFDASIYGKAIPSKDSLSTATKVTSSIDSAFSSAVGEKSMDSRLATIKATVNHFYGDVFGTPGYPTDVKPRVDASTSWSQLTSALDRVLKEPIELYAD